MSVRYDPAPAADEAPDDFPLGGPLLLALLVLLGFATGYVCAAEHLEPGIRWVVAIGATVLAVITARDTHAIAHAGDPFRGCTGFFNPAGMLRHDKPCPLHPNY